MNINQLKFFGCANNHLLYIFFWISPWCVCVVCTVYKIMLGHWTFSKQLAEMTEQLAKCSNRMTKNDFAYKYSMGLCTYTSAG